jgi:threonylcarbamoyladenosine tRNA methylthiotransferase MtaB
MPASESNAASAVAGRPIRTAAITTLGCRLNQAESYAAQVQLARAGVEIVPFGEPADLSIVNTCTVTHVADQQARQVLRRAKRINPEGFVVAMGCYVRVSTDEVRAVEGVDVIVTADKADLVPLLEEMGLALGAGASEDDEIVDPDQRVALPATRIRQFVKIQDGCDDYCTYCIVPFARGHALSRPADAVVQEVRELVGRGCREVVLTGVQIGAYGRDRYRQRGDDLPPPGAPLAALVRRVLDETTVARVRISSIQPQDWSPDFLELFDDSRLGRHLHLPLQAGSDAVLRRMSRRYTTGDFAALVDRLREQVPDIAITADIIVGFPGETDQDHTESVDFARRIEFADAHVFRYSPRRGTAASRMMEQVQPEVKKARSEEMRAVVDETSMAFRRGFVGTTRPVLWEEELDPLPGQVERRWSGLTDNYLRVLSTSDPDVLGTVSTVVVESLDGTDLIGSHHYPSVPHLGRELG